VSPRSRRFFSLILLALSLVAASSVPAEPPPVFLTRWGTIGSGDGQFSNPRGVAVDASGVVYVADSANQRIQKFSSSGAFQAEWGTSGTDGGQVAFPYDVAVDSSGNVYVADSSNHRIQKLDSSGTFLRTWGWGVQDGSSAFQVCITGCQAGILGSGDGQFDHPHDLAFDASGNIYVADSGNHRIQKFNSAGTFLTKWGSLGIVAGAFNSPFGVAVDASGYVYVADFYNHRIQKFNSSGTFQAQWGTRGSGDGELASPYDVVVDASGDVYVADFDNHRIQKFDSSGIFLTKWGAFCDIGVSGASGCDGQFYGPVAVTVDASGNVYVAEFYNSRIQKFAGPWLDLFIGEPDLLSGY